LLAEESLIQSKKSARGKNKRKTNQLTVPLKPLYEFLCFMSHAKNSVQK